MCETKLGWEESLQVRREGDRKGGAGWRRWGGGEVGNGGRAGWGDGERAG